MDWKNILVKILKYAIATIAGALAGASVSGCASVPLFIF